MDEKNKNIPQPQQPGEETHNTEQPTQPAQPEAPMPSAQPTMPESAQPVTQPQPAQPVTQPQSVQSVMQLQSVQPEPTQPMQPQSVQPAPAQPAVPAPPTGDPVQSVPAPVPAQPLQPGVSQPQPAPASAPAPAPAAQPQTESIPQPAPQPQSGPQPQPQPGPTPQPQSGPAPAPTSQPQPGPTPQPQPQQGPVAQPQQPGAGYVPPQPTYNPGAGVPIKPKGTAALVCGIISILVAWFSPIVAIILAIIAIVLSRRAVRQTGKNGKTTGGLICGIAGIVCAIISFIIAMVMSVSIVGGVIDDANNSAHSSSGSFAAQVLPNDLSADEKACADLGITKLDQLKNQDEEIVNYLAAELDEGFEESMGVTHAELGTSSVDLARWMLTDFSYSYDGVYVDDEEGTATMYADLEMRDSFMFMNNFYDLANDFVNSGEADSMTAEQASKRLGEYYNQAMDETTDMTSYYTAIDFVKNADGTWSVDEDEWDKELGYMFGIY